MEQARQRGSRPGWSPSSPGLGRDVLGDAGLVVVPESFAPSLPKKTAPPPRFTLGAWEEGGDPEAHPAHLCCRVLLSGERFTLLMGSSLLLFLFKKVSIIIIFCGFVNPHLKILFSINF